MKYTDVGFRAVYNHFCAFMLDDGLKSAIQEFAGASKADCVLVYGYIDHTCGLTLEVLAAGIKTPKGFRFADGINNVKSVIRIGAVKETEFYIFEGAADEDLRKKHAAKLKALTNYDVSEDIQKTREMGFLDGSRHEECVDDVLVYLTRDGFEKEACWLRLEGLGDHYIVGELLNEPEQDFGYHIGDKIAFTLHELEDKSIICTADLTPRLKLKAEDLEDGTMLAEAIRTFNAEHSKEHLIDVLEILRDSYVWIPCFAIMSDADKDAFDEIVTETEENEGIDSLIGQTLTTEDPVRFVPDILSNGEVSYFPVFSSEDEMGEYGKHMSKTQQHFLKAISLARNNKADVAGIIVNAYSEPFVLERSLFDIVGNMKSILE